jgi:hypothetical protein
MNGILVPLAFLCFLTGLRFGAQEQYDRTLKTVPHTCPATIDDGCTTRIPFSAVLKLVGFSLGAYPIALALALCIVLRLQPVDAAATPPTIVGRATGSPAIAAVPYATEPEWYSDHEHWLQDEATRDEKAGRIATYALGEAQYAVRCDLQPCTAAQPFTLVLRVPEPYRIASRAAFRMTASSGGDLFERLDPVPAPAFRELHVMVTNARPGDRILVLFRVETPAPQLPIVVPDVVRASLQ